MIYDQTRHPATVAALRAALTSRGWDVVGSGPWVGAVPVTTVYYPVGMEAQAKELMAAFPSIPRSRPSFAGVPDDALTVIICKGFKPA